MEFNHYFLFYIPDIQPVTVVPPFVEKGILTELCRFLSIDACNHAKVAQVIAELAKVGKWFYLRSRV